MICLAWLVGGLAGSGSLGCVVSESKYKSKTEELALCETARADLSVERNKLRDQVPELEARMKEQLDASKDELEALREQRAELDKQVDEYETLTSRFKEMVGSDGINVDVRRGRMIVSLPSEVLFASGSAELSKRGATTMEKVAGKLKDLTDRRFIIAGHTDNVPIGKKEKVGFADNWDLSTARALNVTKFLVAQGMDPANLAAAGYGEHDPVRSNKDKRGRQLNRRIEIILEPRLPDFRKLAKLTKQASQIAGKKDDAKDDAKDDKKDDKKDDSKSDKKDDAKDDKKSPQPEKKKGA